MLDDAVAAFLERIDERGFDQPLLALLRAEGFSRVHLVHGSVEFGKDVIAQRDGEQWAFQSKGGNISQSQWSQMTGQLDQLRTSSLGGHDFDTSLPRRAVLVCTGKLSGQASMLAREYQERAVERQEPELDIWDRDILVGKLAGNADSVLGGSIDGQLLGLLGAADQQALALGEIEEFSRRWTSWEPERRAGLGLIEAAIACDRLAAAERLDLACQLALCMVCAAHAGGEADEPVADGAGELFELYAARLFDENQERLLHEKWLVNSSGPSSWVGYRVRAVRIAELLGLYALRRRAVGDHQGAIELAEWVNTFVEAQPGAAQPIGDRYAVSLVPPLLALGPERATWFLRRATVWLCDRYEKDELGLAAVDAGPELELAHLFGGALDHISVKPRRESILAGVLLDVAAVLDLAEAYSDIRNDTLAVGLYPSVLVPGEGPDRFLRSGHSNHWDFNPDYAAELSEGEAAAPHLADASSGGPPQRWWDLLAASAALRDRHFPEAFGPARAEGAADA